MFVNSGDAFISAHPTRGRPTLRQTVHRRISLIVAVLISRTGRSARDLKQIRERPFYHTSVKKKTRCRIPFYYTVFPVPLPEDCLFGPTLKVEG